MAVETAAVGAASESGGYIEVVKSCEPQPAVVVQSTSTSKTVDQLIDANTAVEKSLLGDFTSKPEIVHYANSEPLIKAGLADQGLFEELSEKLAEATDLNQLALPSAEVAKETIAKLPPHVIAENLQRYFKSADLGLISDQHQFAQKLAQEYLDENPERYEKSNYPSVIHFSLSKKFNDSPVSEFQFTKKSRHTKIYAHLKMDPSVVNNSHIFVKWMNLSNNKVMLFNKKRISAHSDQNWVNLKPDKGWRPGAYKVKLYQFDASLTPIVEGQYYVYEKSVD